MVADTALGRVLLGLDGLVLTGVELVDGGAWLRVATTAARTGCCGRGQSAGMPCQVDVRKTPPSVQPVVRGPPG